MAGIDLSGMDPWSNIPSATSAGSSAGGFGSILGAAGSLFGGPIGGLVGSLAGGLFGGGGDDDAAHNARREAKKMRDWQYNMSSTAWRRGVWDMQQAGINPMLAFDKGGASTPPGAMPHYFATGQSKMASAARGAEITNAAALTAAQVSKLLADTKLASAQATEVEARTPVHASTIQRNTAEISRWAQLNGLTVAETENAIKSWEEINSRINLNLAQKLKILQHENPKLDADAANALASALHHNASAFNLRAETKLKTFAGDLTDVVHLPDASKFIHSAAEKLGETAGRVSEFFRDARPSSNHYWDGKSRSYKRR